MNRALSFVIMVLILTLGGYAQAQTSAKGCKNARLNKDKPGVYISFERAGRRAPLEVDESNEGIWLRLHNNTCWKLIFPAFGVPDGHGDVGMYYEVTSIKETTSEPPVGNRLGHIYSTVQLAPGKSTLFSIPREHLANGLALRISLSYEWENQDDVFAGREAKHYVYFSSSALPQGLRQGK